MTLSASRFVAVFAVYLLPLGLATAGFGQEPAVGRALGVVTRIDAAARQITLKTDTSEIAVVVDPKAKVLRVAPGAVNLANAANIELSEIGLGDRLRARGRMDDGTKSLAALEIVVISQSDIAGKQAAERADWDRRGTTGIVSEVAGDHVTINMRTLEGIKILTITPAPNAVVRRYTPDSVKFADAKPSTLSEIRKGDQVRARGNKAADGLQMTAEEIVSGQFKMIAGVVISVDAQENVIRINNVETKKPMTVKISADSSLKRLQPQLAQVIANRLHGVAGVGPDGGVAGQPAGGNPANGAGGTAGDPSGAGRAAGRGSGGGPGSAPIGGDGAAAPGGAFAGRGPGNPGGGRGPGGFAGGRGGNADLQSMIDRTPPIKVSDLMIGDAVIVSSVNGAGADQVTAITLLAGVEAILTKPGTREMSLGDWNMGGGDLGGIGQ